MGSNRVTWSAALFLFSGRSNLKGTLHPAAREEAPDLVETTYCQNVVAIDCELVYALTFHVILVNFDRLSLLQIIPSISNIHFLRTLGVAFTRPMLILITPISAVIPTHMFIQHERSFIRTQCRVYKLRSSSEFPIIKS